MPIPPSISSNTYNSLSGNGKYKSQLLQQLKRQDSGKKSPSLIYSFPPHPRHHLTSLRTSLQLFTKKTGAGYNKNSNDSMIGLIEALAEAIQPLQHIMSSKQVLVDLRLQTILVTPWISHFDQLLNNIIRILNDRISMLWRKQSRTGNGNAISQPYDTSCGLYDDVNEIMNILQKILQVFIPRQVALKRLSSKEKPGNNQQSNSGSAVIHQTRQHSPNSSTTPSTSIATPPTHIASPSSITTIVDCELCSIIKQLVSRCHSHLLRTFPALLKRIEKYLTTVLSSCLEEICKHYLIKNCFVVSKRAISSKQLDSPTSIHMFGYTIRDTLLQPIMLSVKTYCKSRSSIERIMTLSVNNSVDFILNDIKGKKLRFNEYGVYILYTLLNTVLQWSISSKMDLGIPPSNPLILDAAPWYRANSILQLLLMVTSGELVSVRGVVDPLETQNGSLRYRALSNGDLTNVSGNPSNPSGGTTHSSTTTKKLGRHLTIFEYERWVELGVPPKICCISILLIPNFLKNRRIHGAVSLSTTLDIRDI